MGSRNVVPCSTYWDVRIFVSMFFLEHNIYIYIKCRVKGTLLFLSISEKLKLFGSNISLQPRSPLPSIPRTRGVAPAPPHPGTRAPGPGCKKMPDTNPFLFSREWEEKEMLPFDKDLCFVWLEIWNIYIYIHTTTVFISLRRPMEMPSLRNSYFGLIYSVGRQLKMLRPRDY